MSVRLGRAVRTETGRRELASRLATLEPEQRRLIALALPALQALLEEPA